MDQVKPKTREDLAAREFISSLSDFQDLMKAMAAKFKKIQDKQIEIENDFVAVMETQMRHENRLAKIETAFFNGGVPGFRTPWYKRLFRVKDHMSHLENKNGSQPL